MNEEERQKELQYLIITLEEVKQQLLVREEVCRGQQSQLKSALSDYWNDKNSNAVDEAQFVEAVGRQKAISSVIHGKGNQLRRMLDSPYFGRIDFQEDGDSPEAAEKVYIGIATLTRQSKNEFLVYDWRAPISSMYYDFELGKASYACPAEIVTGTVVLKRHYKIVNGQMKYLFDADIHIDDEMLREILAKSADDKMHTIVTSIQREQNRIIRNENYRALFVQGPAGSGKTSVALHRLAFLLYRDRERITAQNVLILSPNHLFSDYISNVLPEIGEDVVPQMTFQDYVAGCTENVSFSLETRTDHLEGLLAHKAPIMPENRTKWIRFKSSTLFEQALVAYLDWMQTSLVDDYPAVEYRGKVYFSQQEWKTYYGQTFVQMPPAVRLEKIRQIILTRLRPMLYTVRDEKEAEIVNAGEEINNKVIKAMARVAAQREMSPVVDQVGRLTSLSPIGEYRKLFEQHRLCFYLPANIEKEDWGYLRKYTLKYLNRGILPYEDIPSFLYLQGVLQGFPVRRDIYHLVIDEAQDYTALQYKILTRLFPNCSWTVVGDTAQVVHPFLNTVNLAEARSLINLPESEMFVLTRSYRSTVEIQAFCHALLPDEVTAVGIERHGALPRVMQVCESENMISSLSTDITSLLREGWNSIAIITKTIAEGRRLFEALPTSMDVILIDTEEADFVRGIVVIPSFLAKGLEFDAVLVPSLDVYRQDEERNLLYTVCTRALHRLDLYYQTSPSPFLDKIDKQLYKIS